MYSRLHCTERTNIIYYFIYLFSLFLVFISHPLKLVLKLFFTKFSFARSYFVSFRRSTLDKIFTLFYLFIYFIYLAPRWVCR